MEVNNPLEGLLQVTEKSRMEHEISDFNEFSRVMFSAAPVGLSVIDENMKIIDTNDAILEMFGVEKQYYIERYGETFPEYQPDGSKTAEIITERFKRALSGEKQVFENMRRSISGEPIPCEITYIRVEHCGKRMVLGYLYDLRNIKRMEGEIETALFEAEEANRAKSEFLSNMSHEMLTPMNAIIGMAQIARMSGLPGNSLDCINEIEKASRHLLELIKGLLDVSDKKGIVFELVESAFSFSDMFRKVLDEVRPFAANKHQALSHDIDPLIPIMLFGDEGRLSQVIAHLISNAIKFTPEYGEVAISACLFSDANDNNDDNNGIITLQIEVADDGVGISKRQQESIFSIFEQVDNAVVRKHGGVGLGLPLSRRIIEMMGGRIWVKSELGKGSIFTFTCKLRKAP